jgi:CHAD domain-containing protein
MFTSATPFTGFVNQIRILRSQLPAVRNGDPKGVHDARVASRRIRELLELVEARHVEDIQKRIRKMGRALGRVRDVDVRIALLTRLESRIPPAAPALVTLRHALEQKRAKRLRTLIKKLERLRLEPLVDQVAMKAIRSSLSHRAAWGHWTISLRRIITARSHATAEAIDRASGVYFPNRIHRARIAIKKMRYALEIANESGVADFADHIFELKQMQDALGELHDRQSLLDELPVIKSSDLHETNAPLALIREVLHANVLRLHARYVSQRDRLLAIAREVEVLPIGHRWGTPISVAAGLVALASPVVILSHRRLSGS